MLIDQGGQAKAALMMGEHKSLQTDRVVLVPGPEEEVGVVRWIYDAFVEEGKSEREIAGALNARGILTDFGRPWTRGTVHQLLTNEKYIGNNVYHRTSFKLKKKHVQNPPEKWIRAEGAFPSLVAPELFQRARELILARSQRLTDAEMLDRLRAVLAEHGALSGILIDESDNAPSSAAFRHRFGSLLTAYRLIRYEPPVDYSFIDINRRLRQRHADIVQAVIGQIEAHGSEVHRDSRTDLLHLNRELRVSLVLCRHVTTGAGASRWTIRLDAGLRPDITIAVRMDKDNEEARDYYVLPGVDMTWENLRVAEDNGIYLDAYRFSTLDFFLGLTERANLEAAA